MSKVLLAAVIALGAWWFFFRPACGHSGTVACPKPELETGVGSAISAAEVCPTAGYLCRDPQKGRAFQVTRWPLDKGKLRVRVTLPDFADDLRGKQLRDMAVEGIMEWDRRPFPIVVSTSKLPLAGWDINVVWSVGLFNSAAGLSRVGWKIDGKRVDFMNDGLAVVVPPTAMMPLTLDEGTRDLIRAIASHEMGHSIGLGHSDNPNDVMYPMLRQLGERQNHAGDRDFKTVETLYTLPNGAMLQ